MFNLHLDIGTVDGNALRVTVGNVLKDLDTANKVCAVASCLGCTQATAWAIVPCDTRTAPTITSPAPRPAVDRQRKSGTLTLAMPAPSRRWTLLCIDLAAAAATASCAPFACLRSVQLCSNMSVRGAFSSEARFGIQVPPAHPAA
jgi:hypothetical protein